MRTPGNQVTPQPVSARVATWRFLAAGFLSTLCLFLSLPPFGLIPFAPLAAVLATVAGLWAARPASRPLRAGLLFAMGALPLWLIQLLWLYRITPVGYPLLAIYQSLYCGAFVWLLARVQQRWPQLPLAIVVPTLWVMLEVFRGDIVLTGFCWYLLGHSFIDVPPLAAPAGLLGAYFISFLVAAVCGAGTDLVRARTRSVCLWRPALTLIGVVAAWGAMALPAGTRSASGAPLRVGVVQTNLPQFQKMAWPMEQRLSDTRRWLQLTSQLMSQQPKLDLVVWPETMFTGAGLSESTVKAVESVFLANNPTAQASDRPINSAIVDAFKAVQAEGGVPLLIGSDEVTNARMERDAQGRADLASDQRFNSAVLIHDGRVLPDRYDKIDLTPFGEVIPWLWRVPALQRAVLAVGAGGMKFDLNFGERAEPIVIPGVTDPGGSSGAAMATPICFEITRSSLCRRLTYTSSGTRRANVLINISNDGWFGPQGGIRGWVGEAARQQHLLAARWRCVELGMPLVRAVNTGISSFVDRRGRVLPRTPASGAKSEPSLGMHVEEGYSGTVEMAHQGGGTLFGLVGNSLAWLVTATGTMLSLASLRRRRSNHASP